MNHPYNHVIIWKKALENLSAANDCLHQSQYNVSVSRAYYACAQAAYCALMINGSAPLPKDANHLKIHAAYHTTYSKTLMKTDTILRELHENRNEADYTDINQTRGKAIYCKNEASALLNHIKRHLNLP